MITHLEEDYCHNPSDPDVQSMFLALQNTLEMKFSFLNKKMDVMSEKVTSIEKKNSVLLILNTAAPQLLVLVPV